jgi:hypothetical protein
MSYDILSLMKRYNNHQNHQNRDDGSPDSHVSIFNPEPDQHNTAKTFFTNDQSHISNDSQSSYGHNISYRIRRKESNERSYVTLSHKSSNHEDETKDISLEEKVSSPYNYEISSIDGNQLEFDSSFECENNVKSRLYIEEISSTEYNSRYTEDMSINNKNSAKSEHLFIDELSSNFSSNIESPIRRTFERSKIRIFDMAYEESQKIGSSILDRTVESINMILKDDSEIQQHDESASHKHQRTFKMMDMRIKNAKMRIPTVNKTLKSGSKHDSIHRSNNICDRYINIYSKGLPHDNEGYVDKHEIRKLIKAVRDKNTEKLSYIKLGSELKLVNPSAAWSNDIIGSCSDIYRYSSLPNINSEWMAAEMSELYCMSLSRDVPFDKYISSPIIEDCCGYLNSLKLYPHVDGHVSFDNIFRGPMYGDLHGPYISQFLYRDIITEGLVLKQKYITDLEGHDFIKTWDNAISAQNGKIESSLDKAFRRNMPRYIVTGRDLSCRVHNDDHSTLFYNACIILMDLKVPMNPGILKLSSNNHVETNFINFGKPDIHSMLSIVGRSALLAIWNIKWNELFIRPEAFGIEIERVFKNKENLYGISPNLLKNASLVAVRSKNGNVLLSQSYPEGSPLYPSTPSSHGAIGGACATVLKFFFNADCEMDIYEPNDDGQDLMNIGKKTTVYDEINKLASNVSIGRSWAGVNYHMDTIMGLKMGEKIAVECLKDMVHRYPMNVEISFKSFSDKIITISNI